MTTPDTITTGDGRTIPLSELQAVAETAQKDNDEWRGNEADAIMCDMLEPCVVLAILAEVRRQAEEIASLRERVDELEAGRGTTSIRPVFPIQSEDMP